MTVRLTALRPLYGDYGRVQAGQSFETDSETAESLEARGLAERYRQPVDLRAMFSPVVENVRTSAQNPGPIELPMPAAKRAPKKEQRHAS